MKWKLGKRSILGKKGVFGEITLKPIGTDQKKIAPAKLKDLKARTAFIPVQYSNYYTGLQSNNQSPLKLREGRTLPPPELTTSSASDSDSD